MALAVLAALALFATTVDLGERTLFGHLRAIGDTKESRDLVRGTKEKAGEVGEYIGERVGWAEKPDKSPAPEMQKKPGKGGAVDESKANKSRLAGPPSEQLTEGDRDAMKRLLESERR